MRDQTTTKRHAQPSAPVTSGVFQRQCVSCGNHTVAGGECQECGKRKQFGLQTKLRVNEPGDVYEREADRIADQVMAAPSSSMVGDAPLRIQRFAGQSDTAPAGMGLPLAGSDRPLEPALRLIQT